MKPRPYTTQRERIFLGGFDAVRQRRRKVCSSKKFRYAWLRVDPCIEMPEEKPKTPALGSSKDVSKFLHDAVPFAGRPGEHFMIVCLNNKNQPIAVGVPHIGGRNSCAVDTSIVLQAVLLTGSSAFIVAHNHPSDNPAVSPEDIRFTRVLRKAGDLVGVRLLDSLVVTRDPDHYTSMSDMGVLTETGS